MKKAFVDIEEKAVPVVDAVFVIGTGSKNGNEELKYALRNLDRNCPFVRNVYICGECPSWVDTSVVKHLKWPDRFRHAKDANIIDKLRHACEQPGISEHILFCSDDQFQTRVCTWDDFAPRWLRQYKPTDDWYENRKRVWHTRLHKTLDRDRQRRLKEGLNPDNVYYYQPHIWMQIDRDKFIEYAKWSDYEHRDDTIIASGYFNYIDATGKYNYDHVFISAGQKWPVKETHVAYSDGAFLAAMKYLRAEFKEPCRFEVAKPAKISAKNANDLAVEKLEDGLPKPLSFDSIADAVKRDNHAWVPFMGELRRAAELGKTDAKGKDVVCRDIERRWNAATQNGTLYVPVTEKPSDEAAKVLGLGKPEETAKPAGPKKCSKCEERRRKAEEARAAAAKAAAEHASGTDATPAAVESTRQLQTPEAKPAPAAREVLLPPATETPAAFASQTACMDCAIDHLSAAAAYLNSDGGQPDMMDIVRARGEVIVAMRHLGELGYGDARVRCMKALSSWKSENSIFSAETFYGILESVIENQR